MSFILACTVMVLSVVYTDAFQSRTENFNKKYTLTGNQADDIASVAVAQLGRKGKAFDYTEDWCVNFVRDCARCAGIPDSVIPECSGVSDMYNTLLSCGAVRVSSPRRGDLVFYSNPSEGFTHMGLMIDSLQSVHGNVNGHGDDYTFMRTSEVDEFKYSSFRPGSPCFLRPKYSNAASWKSSLKKADLGNDFYARIVNPETGKALTADKGNNVVSFSKKNSEAQAWRFKKNKDGTYSIINAYNGRALGIYNSSKNSGANVFAYVAGSENAQKWSVYGKNGSYFFTADCTGCVIDAGKTSASDGSNVVMSLKNNAATQRFSVEKITAPTERPKLRLVSKGRSVAFSWNKVSGATSYDLKITKNGRDYITVSDITSTSVTLSLPDGSYSAVLTGKNIIPGARSAAYRFTVNNKFTDKVSYTCTASTITLEWKQVEGAKSYTVYQYRSGEWKKIATKIGAKNVTCRIDELKAGTVYKFKIKVHEKITGTIFGKETGTVLAATNPSAPKLVSVSGYEDSVRLEWKKVAGASGYIIYQYKSGEWKRIATVSKGDTTAYRVKRLSAGTTYKFKLKTLKEIDGKTLYSRSTSEIIAVTKPEAPRRVSNSSKSTSVKLKWTVVERAGGYIVEQYASGKWKTADTVTGNETVTAVISGLKPGRTYKFRIRSYKKAYGKTYRGSATGTVSVATKLK